MGHDGSGDKLVSAVELVGGVTQGPLGFHVKAVGSFGLPVMVGPESHFRPSVMEAEFFDVHGLLERVVVANFAGFGAEPTMLSVPRSGVGGENDHVPALPARPHRVACSKGMFTDVSLS